MSKKIFPTLYKRTSTGALQEWTIEVNDNEIVTRFGQTGGAIQETAPTICVGKNTGKANETTADEQALLEAEAQWTKKLKREYVRTQNAATMGAASNLVEGGILPMLAHKFSEHGDKLVYPCYCQPKYDGHRCIAMTDKDGKCTLWSRTRKPILSMPHIVKAVESFKLPHIVLDGELYNADYHDKFEELTHFIRQSKPEAGCEIVEYYVYDTAMNSLPFSERNEWLCELLGPKGMDCITLSETLEVNNEDELMIAFEDFLEQGYEGAIARNAAGLYVNKRSYDLLKIKQFSDAEYKCVTVEEGKGKMAGHAIFVCVTADGTEFKAKMKGDHDALAKYYEKPKLVVGKQVTIKYQGLTTKNKVPRFPVALRIRNDI